MRSELEQIQYIESYLQGKLTKEEQADFEQKMAGDPSFKSEFENQRKLENTIKRSALLLTLNDIHSDQFGGNSVGGSAKAWWQNIWLNIFVVTGLLFGAGALFLAQEEQPISNDKVEAETAYITNNQDASVPLGSSSQMAPDEKEVSVQNIEVKKDIIPLKPISASSSINKEGKGFNFQCLAPVYDTLIYIQGEELSHQYKGSKTVINLPADLLQGVNKGSKTKLLYREYRNSAQIAFSGIPMVYNETGEELRFNSAGMFEFIPLDSKVKMNSEAFDKVNIDFELTQNIDSIGYFELKNNKWKKIGELESLENFEMEEVDEELIIGNVMFNYSKKLNMSEMKEESKTLVQNEINKDFEDFLLGGPFDCNFSKGCNYKITATSGTKAKLAYPGPNSLFNDPMVKIKGGDNASKEPMVFDLMIGNEVDGETFSMKVRVYAPLVDEYTKEPLKCIPVKRQLLKLLSANCVACSEREKMTKANLGKLKQDYVKTKITLEEDGTYLNPGAIQFPLKASTKQMIAEYKRKFKGLPTVAATVNSDIKQVDKVKTKAYTKYQIQGYGNGGHTMSGIVSGLRVKGFGVYNCDAVNQIKNRVKRRAIVQSGDSSITKKDIIFVNLIDLKYNSAFSFDPNKIVLNKNARNVFLVFTKSARLLIVEPKEVHELAANPTYKIKAVDVTDEVNNSDDLYKKLKQF